MDGTVVQKVAAQKLSPKARSNTTGTTRALNASAGFPVRFLAAESNLESLFPG